MKNPAVISQETQVVVSEHAVRRAQQRGVKRSAIALTTLHGEQIWSAGGTKRRTFTHKTVWKLLGNGYSIDFLESIIGTVVITCEEPDRTVVLTVRPTEKQGKRRGGVGKPKHRQIPESERDRPAGALLRAA